MLRVTVNALYDQIVNCYLKHCMYAYTGTIIQVLEMKKLQH